VPKLPEKMVSVSSAADVSQTDLLVIACYESQLDAVKALDAQYGGALTDMIESNEFKGKAGSSLCFRAGGDAKYVAVVGLGAEDKALAPATAYGGPNAFATLGSAVASLAKANKCKTAGVSLVAGELSAEQVQGVTLGVHLGAYEATRFKSKPNLSKLESVTLQASGDTAAAIAAATAHATGTFMTRYLVEAPPNVCTPTHLAETAQAIAAASPDCMSVKILEKEDCEKLKMGSFLGVAACSEEPLKFIHITYKPKGPVKKKVAVIGKGLTFDSGGYNLKVAGSMIEMMKFDMGGSGATLGAAKIVSMTQPEGVEAHFIVASCENMIDGRGMRPGDVLTAANGKSIEVNNTDAEGRLTLADALIYAERVSRRRAGAAGARRRPHFRPATRALHGL